ncbi:hypothetical protein NHP21011_12780 [Helicobacter heilmannii]|nr:hypothetical protein NHP21011_12780 [Helicobacter heilmannii]
MAKMWGVEYGYTTPINPLQRNFPLNTRNKVYSITINFYNAYSLYYDDYQLKYDLRYN